MDRLRKHSGGDDDESLLAKAAAWAWYKHGTGVEGKSTKKSDVRKSFHEPKPSRFKVEAKKLGEQGVKDFYEGSSARTSWSLQTVEHSSLFDRYEIESISTRLEQLIESSGNKGTVYTKRFLVGDRPAKQYDRIDPDLGWPLLKLQALTSAVGDRRRQGVMLSDGDYANHRRKRNGKNSGGFWQRYAVVCGSSAHEDVILGTKPFVDGRERRQYPERQKAYSPVPVVKSANRRPQVTSLQCHLVIN